MEIQINTSPYSLLVINASGGLIRLICPFRVVLKDPNAGKTTLKILMVDAVHSSKEHILVYIIQKQPYPFNLFIILL
jgi:hypothetical protein